MRSTYVFFLTQLSLSVRGQPLTNTFLWSSTRTHPSDIHIYTSYLLHDLLVDSSLRVSPSEFSALHQQTRIQLRTQLLYKLMLHKHKHLLFNFSPMEPWETKEYLLPITIRVHDREGREVYRDELEWDMLNERNNVEQFC